jgi:hypothetical protein
MHRCDPRQLRRRLSGFRARAQHAAPNSRRPPIVVFLRNVSTSSFGTIVGRRESYGARSDPRWRASVIEKRFLATVVATNADHFLQEEVPDKLADMIRFVAGR